MKIINFNCLIIIASIVFLFAGCSDRSATKYSNKTPQYAQLAKYTQIGKIIIDDEIKAIANITYLNGAQEDQWDNEFHYFIVGTHAIEEDFFSLLMLMKEGEAYFPSSIKKIEKTDPLYENIPFMNHWAKYKLIKFKNLDKGLKKSAVVLWFLHDEENYQEVSFN